MCGMYKLESNFLECAICKGIDLANKRGLAAKTIGALRTQNPWHFVMETLDGVGH